jgi:hypothetical protein
MTMASIWITGHQRTTDDKQCAYAVGNEKKKKKRKRKRKKEKEKEKGKEKLTSGERLLWAWDANVFCKTAKSVQGSYD